MDHGNDHIEEDIRNIMHTRVAISNKLEMLEQRVEEKMERSRMAVKDLVDHTAGVVEGMMDKTKQTFDPLHQFSQRPWVMLGAAVMLGYMAGLIETKMRSSGVYPYYTPETEGTTVMPPGSREERTVPKEGVYPYYPTGRGRQSGARSREMAPHMSFFQDVADGLMEEVDHIKAGVIAAGRVFLRDVSTHIIPSLLYSLGDRVKKDARSSERTSSFRPPDR